MLQEENKAGTHLTVGSLEVLQDVTGPGITRIVQRVEQTNQTVSNLAGEVDRGYREAAADDMITPTEKKTLKKQWNEIQQTYAAILTTANNKQLDDDPIMSTLTAKYEALSSYLDQIQLFVNMNETTQIANAAAFQQKFDEYYSAQIYSQTLISGAKILENITDSGSKGEFAEWNGRLYYNNGDTWVLTDTSGYIGAVSSGNPDRKAGNFFLATASWSINPDTLFMLDVGDGYVLAAGEYVLGVTENFVKGKIYVSDGTAWSEVTDPNNYRYIIAMNDIYDAGIDIPPGVSWAITEKVEEIVPDIVEEAIEEQAPGLIAEYAPKYYGYTPNFPTGAHKNDYCVGSNGRVYQYNGTNWIEKLPTDTANYGLYMTALADIIKNFPDDPNNFAYIFTNLLMAQNAVISNLQVKILELLTGGAIKGSFNGTIDASGHITNNGTTGFALDNNGKAVFNNAVIRNGMVTNGINDFGNNCAIKGNFNGTIDSSGHITSDGTSGFAFDNNGKAVFNDINIRGNLIAKKLLMTIESGNVICGTLRILNSDNITTWISPASGLITLRIRYICLKADQLYYGGVHAAVYKQRSIQYTIDSYTFPSPSVIDTVTRTIETSVEVGDKFIIAINTGTTHADAWGIELSFMGREEDKFLFIISRPQ